MTDGIIGANMMAHKILPRAKTILKISVGLSDTAKQRSTWISWYYAHGKNKRLTVWLGRYNTYRPHQSLNYLTPMAYFNHYMLNYQKEEVFTRYWTRTISCQILAYKLTFPTYNVTILCF